MRCELEVADISATLVLPIHVLSHLFRRLFVERLLGAYGAEQLRFFGAPGALCDAGNFAGALRQMRKKRWIVYATPPFGSPEHVLAYLARYTHRVAIANSAWSARMRRA